MEINPCFTYETLEEKYLTKEEISAIITLVNEEEVKRNV